MRLLILGATGGTGVQLVKQALERGHQVTAFVRSPDKVKRSNGNLKVVAGDLRDTGQLRNVLPGHDVVLSSMGYRGLGRTSIRAGCAESTVDAMSEVGIRRLLVVSAALLFDNIGFPAWVLRHLVLRNVARDCSGMERIVGASKLDWTIVRPPRLTNGSRKEHYRIEDGRLPKRGFHISRADVAHFMLNEVEKPHHIRKVVGVCD